MAEKLVTDIDVGIPGAALRVALGASLVVVLHRALPAAGLPLAAACLAVMLFGVKAFAAVARRFLPSTPVVRTRLEWRRNLARYHDSYQWRKLAWFGIGILLAAAFSGRPRTWEGPLGAACLLAGVVADLVWRRKGLPMAPPVMRKAGELPTTAHESRA